MLLEFDAHPMRGGLEPHAPGPGDRRMLPSVVCQLTLNVGGGSPTQPARIRAVDSSRSTVR
jgi:hypothetical protein